LTAEFELKNTGKMAGAVVAQVYVHPEKPSVMRPEKELKGFKKVFLKPGEKQTVSIPLNTMAFAFYSPEQKAWVAEPDDYKITVGSSSRSLRLNAEFKLTQPSVLK